MIMNEREEQLLVDRLLNNAEFVTDESSMAPEFMDLHDNAVLAALHGTTFTPDAVQVHRWFCHLTNRARAIVRGEDSPYSTGD